MDIFKRDPKARARFFKMKVLFIISGLLQGVAIALTIPLFKSLFSEAHSEIWGWLAAIGLTALVSFIFHFIATNIGNHMAVWEVCDYQIHRIGEAVIQLPLGWVDASSKGKVSKAISTDTNILSHYPSIVLPEMLTVVPTSVVLGIALAFVSWKMGIVVAIMGFLLKYFWGMSLKVLSKIEGQKAVANQEMESTIVEFAQLQTVLRAAGALVNGWDRLDDALEADKEASLAYLKRQASTGFQYIAVANLGLVLILIIAALEIRAGAISIEVFMGITVGMISFANPLAGLLPYGAEIQNASAALNRINEIVEAPRLPEAEKSVPLDGSASEFTQSDGYAIAFEDVSFEYVAGTPVLNHVTFNIPAGSMTALVGPSGSGKSTVNRLIARFWDVDSGRITVNGQDIRTVKPAVLMGAISMVFQKVYLFNTTIRENIALAKPDATMSEIEQAARKARLDEVIARLPRGWDTPVGEGGSALSGGEQQRVSIARAFLKDAPILLLDEITSALDGTNEAIITRSLEELAKNRTVVVIAHRLSSIRGANAIAVIEAGRLTGYGSHEQLMAENHRYASLWNASKQSSVWHV